VLGTAEWFPRRRPQKAIAERTVGTLDGRAVIVSGGSDGTIQLWDLASGAQRGKPLHGHQGWVKSSVGDPRWPAGDRHAAIF
jgi:WD40 repeat protein